MEDRGNKNIICSVLFLDIVEYSKKTVTGQISLKERFNTYLSEAIRDVPVNDRIILDTGDGAAVNFLGDIESSLKAAISLRTSLLNEDPYLEPELLVRIGINLGPVRLVRDINGQPNIVGDGINVAQRIMGFADPSQILVSRSYFDAVSHISAEYTGMFHYQGSRTDKHVREHEIYAIGYPGDQTTRKMAAQQMESPGLTARMLGAVKSFFSKPAVQPETVPAQSGKSRRRLYMALIGVPLALLATLFLLPKKQVEEPPVASVETSQSVVPAETAAQAKPAEDKPSQSKSPPVVHSKVPPEKVAPKPVQSKPQVATQPKHKADSGGKESAGADEVQSQAKTTAPAVKKSGPANPFFPDWPGVGAETSKEGYVVITCKEGTQVFIDGAPKGKISSDPLTISVKPGKHRLDITHAKFGFYTEVFDTDPGKTDHIKPKICN
jgi:outer membrane biosynthesis protein TonB